MELLTPTYAGDPRVLTVNLAAEPVTVKVRAHGGRTGIDKTPVDGPVPVRAPGPKHGGLGSGLEGDVIISRRHHGGDDQAVYAYAREDLDHFAALLGHPLPNGAFGENLTTSGVDASGAVVGERWRIGDGPSAPLLVVRAPRIPCNTFRVWIGARGWLRTFDRAGLVGAYLAVAEPGDLVAGAPIRVEHRPEHGVRIVDLYRAMTTEPARWPGILHAATPDLPADAVEMGRRGETFTLG